MATVSDNDWEYFEPNAPMPVLGGRQIAEGLYPGIRVTEWKRDPNSPLGRKNPTSWHNWTEGAIDAAPVKGMTFEQYVQGYKDAGYDIIEARDEVKKPTKHATGPHWHVVLGGGPKVAEPKIDDEWEYFEPGKDIPKDVEAPVAAPKEPRQANAPIAPGSYDVALSKTPGEEGVPVDDPVVHESMQTIQNMITQGSSYEDIVKAVPRILDETGAKNAQANRDALKWYLANPKYPVQFSMPRNKDIVVEGKPLDEGLVETAGRQIADTVQGVKEGYRGAQNDVVRWGHVLSDAVGLSEGATENFDRVINEVITPENDASFNRPNGWARVAGNLVGESVPYAPLEAARLFSAEGKAGRLVDLTAQGGAGGAIASGGQDVGANMALGAAIAPALGVPAEEILGAVARKFDPEILRAKSADAPEVSVVPEETPNGGRIGKVTMKPTGGKITNVRPKASAVGQYVSDLTSTWKNGPDLQVVQKVDDLPDHVRQGVIDDGAQGSPSFYGSDGKIYMIADNIKNENWAKAAVFHEALGHAGLANKFREDLDGFLTHLYDTNPKIAQETDAWMGRHKGAYDGDTVRAVEEVLALKSNNGELPPSVRNRLTAQIKGWLRNAGLNLKISNRELDGILELAQRTVTRGDNSFVGSTGNKYISEPRFTQGDNDNHNIFGMEPVADIAKATDVDTTVVPGPHKGANQGFSELPDIKREMSPDMDNPDGGGRTKRIPNPDDVFPENKYISPDDLEGVEEPKYIGNLNVDKIKTNRPQVKELLKQVADEIDETNGPVEPLTHEEIKDFAASAGTTYKKLQKMNLSDPKVVYAFRQHFTRTAEKAVDLANKQREGNWTHKDNVNFARTMLELADMQETLQGVARNAGRMLNQFKIITSGSDYDVNGMLKYMSEHGLGNIEKAAEAVATHADNPAAVQKVARDITKPFWEDYVTTVRYQFMLSGLGTHARNFAGNATMLALDMIEHGMAGLGGQALRLTKNPHDRIPLRESAFRMAGIFKALRDAETYAKSWQAFKEGSPVYKVSKLEETNHRILPFGKVTQYPTNLLAMGDQFFRPLIENAHINGQAFRQAFQEGVKGYDNIVERAYEIIDDVDHGRRVRENADAQTAELQLIGENSRIGKLFANASARKADTAGADRMVRFLVQNLFPFTRVNDNLMKASFRRNIIFGWLDSENRKLLRTGSRADKSLVASRMILGTTIVGALNYWAFTGDLEADDFGNATLFGIPLQGFDAIGKAAQVVAGTWKEAEESKDTSGFINGSAKAAGLIVKELIDVSALAGVGNFFQIFEGGAKAKGFGASTAASFVVPNIARQYQELNDPMVRDQTGNGELDERFMGKVKAAFDPESLPIRHDELGRELKKPGNTFSKIVGVGRTKEEFDEPVDKALKEFGGVEKLIGRANKYVEMDGERIDMTAEQHQQFIQISGQLIKDTLNRDVQTEEWKKSTDAEKKKWVKEVRTEARKVAKEQLFSSEPDDSEWEIIE